MLYSLSLIIAGVFVLFLLAALYVKYDSMYKEITSVEEVAKGIESYFGCELKNLDNKDKSIAAYALLHPTSVSKVARMMGVTEHKVTSLIAAHNQKMKINVDYLQKYLYVRQEIIKFDKTFARYDSFSSVYV